MYHRFEENKYPSTNIRIEDFKKHLEIINNEGLNFITLENFLENFDKEKKERNILLTIDDAFLSFYNQAWPFLKRNKIPFILFVSTREVGKNGYMNWDQIREISQEDFVHIGHHSHSHEYLVDEDIELIKKDLLTANKIFSKELGEVSKVFSYPFGEYSVNFKELVKNLGFSYAFGQHSGVIDNTKDLYELPRFPINEKYGDLERFSTILKTLPFKYENIIPEERYITDKTNPPSVKIKFKKLYNLKNINCFSNEEDKWRKSKIVNINDTTISVSLMGKFTTERGRINCSLRSKTGFYHWLGIQFVVAEK